VLGDEHQSGGSKRTLSSALHFVRLLPKTPVSGLKDEDVSTVSDMNPGAYEGRSAGQQPLKYAYRKPAAIVQRCVAQIVL
jgi:hypothetical protein